MMRRRPVGASFCGRVARRQVLSRRHRVIYDRAHLPDQTDQSSMDISLAGRSAVITGGSKGIGLAIATRFAASGADVAIVARGREALDAAVKQIDATAKGRVIGAQGDVAVAADVTRVYGEAMA